MDAGFFVGVARALDLIVGSGASLLTSNRGGSCIAAKHSSADISEILSADSVKISNFSSAVSSLRELIASF